MFWVLKRTVSLRGFFWVPTTFVWLRNKKIIFGTLSSLKAWSELFILQKHSKAGGLISKEIASSNDSINVFDPEKAVHDKLPEIHISVDESETPSTSGSYSDLKPSPSWSLTNIKSAISSIKLPGIVSTIFNPYPTIIFLLKMSSAFYVCCIFVWFDSLNSQSAIFQSCQDGFSFGWTSTKQQLNCLAQWHNTVPLVSLEPATFDPQSNTLPTEPLNALCTSAAYIKVYFRLDF